MRYRGTPKERREREIFWDKNQTWSSSSYKLTISILKKKLRMFNCLKTHCGTECKYFVIKFWRPTTSPMSLQWWVCDDIIMKVSQTNKQESKMYNPEDPQESLWTLGRSPAFKPLCGENFLLSDGWSLSVGVLSVNVKGRRWSYVFQPQDYWLLSRWWRRLSDHVRLWGYRNNILTTF